MLVYEIMTSLNSLYSVSTNFISKPGKNNVRKEKNKVHEDA